MVEQSGYRVVEAKDGTEAMNVFHQLHPDLVLLNAIMPDMDRFELCSMVQSIEQNKHTPILMITELEDTELIERVFQVSTMDYVTKPINWQVLRQRVRRLIEQSQLHQKLFAAKEELQRLATLVTIDFFNSSS